MIYELTTEKTTPRIIILQNPHFGVKVVTKCHQSSKTIFSSKYDFPSVELITISVGEFFTQPKVTITIHYNSTAPEGTSTSKKKKYIYIYIIYIYYTRLVTVLVGDIENNLFELRLRFFGVMLQGSK